MQMKREYENSKEVRRSVQPWVIREIYWIAESDAAKQFEKRKYVSQKSKLEN